MTEKMPVMGVISGGGVQLAPVIIGSWFQTSGTKTTPIDLSKDYLLVGTEQYGDANDRYNIVYISKGEALYNLMDPSDPTKVASNGTWRDLSISGTTLSFEVISGQRNIKLVQLD